MELAEREPGKRWLELVNTVDVDGDTTMYQKELANKNKWGAVLVVDAEDEGRCGVGG